jgi:NAD(P)-dependent dehydrogenase (short-subunit alcohol dehydrogenase family)
MKRSLEGEEIMSPVLYPEAQLAPLQAQTERVILVTGGLRDAKLAQDLREEIRNSGWDCEIVQGDVSDCAQIRKLVHDVLDSFQHVGMLVNKAGITRDSFIPKMTDEEWLAQ